MSVQEEQTKCPKVEFTCPCPKTTCENHGICCKCVTRHRSGTTPVYCMRPFMKQE